MSGHASAFQIGRRAPVVTLRRMETPADPAAATLSSTAIPSKDERTWAMLAHVSAFAMYLTGIGHLVGPLIVWLVKRDGNPFVDDQGKESLNFQISWSIYMILNFCLFFTLILAPLAIAGFFILPIFHVICMIIGALKANDGVAFRYPLCIRFL